MTFTESQVRSLIDHVRGGHSLAKHDVGHRLAEVLEYLLERPTIEACGPDGIVWRNTEEIELSP